MHHLSFIWRDIEWQYKKYTNKWIFEVIFYKQVSEEKVMNIWNEKLVEEKNYS